MSDPPAAGFEHHHTDEALRAWLAVPAESKLRWLHEALELTRAMLPQSRRRAWLLMRCEEPGASVPIETLRNDWPPFLTALDSGADALEALARDLVSGGESPRGAREILLALREWLPLRPDARASDAAIVDEALRRLA